MPIHNFIAPLIGSSGQGGGYVIEGSGLTDDSSSRLDLTFGTADSRRIMVFDFIVKVNDVSGFQYVMCSYPGTGSYEFAVGVGGGGTARLDLTDSSRTNQYQSLWGGTVARDPSAYYHVVAAIDTTQATEADRVRVWINGAAASKVSGTIPAQNTDLYAGGAYNHRLLASMDGSPNYADLYAARIAWLDNLTITNPETDGFGEAVGNGWQINDISGLAYGTIGFLIEGGTDMAAGTDSHTTGSATSTFTASSTAYQAGAPTNWAGNFDGISIGTASADRVVVVAISGNNGSTGVPSAVTIAGNSATLAGSTYVGGESDSSIWYATVATGTTADIDITYSAGKQSVSIGVYAITGCNPDPLDTSGSTTADTPSTTITAHPGSTLIACASHAVASGTTTTWTGPTEDYDEDDAPTTDNCGFTSASSDYSALQDEITVTASADGTAATSSMACAVWEASGTNHFLKTGTITATNDSPTDDAANDKGNYCTLLPISSPSPGTYSNGNLSLSPSSNEKLPGTIAFDSSDSNGFYWEVTIGANVAGTLTGLGIGVAATNGKSTGNTYQWENDGYDAKPHSYFWQGTNTDYYKFDSTSSTGHTAFADNDIVGFFIRNGKSWVHVNGTWQNSGNPNTDTNPMDTTITGMVCPYFVNGGANRSSFSVNFGQSSFSYTPPTGAKNLCTANLPAPTVTDPSAYFSVGTHTG